MNAVSAVRAGLVAGGAAIAGYGGWLLWPQLPAAWTWLVAGPVLHDAIVAPAIGIASLALGRLVTDPAQRVWIAGGLAASAVLALIAVPLLWRPQPAPINPGLHDRDYSLGLVMALLALWTAVLVGAACRRLRRSRRPSRSARRHNRQQRPGADDYGL